MSQAPSASSHNPEEVPLLPIDHTRMGRLLWRRTVYDSFRAIHIALSSSWANVLLILVPLGLMADSLGWSDAATFTLNFLAIFALASVLTFATEELSAKVGQTVGGLINATFGNAVELIVGTMALRRGEISVVQSSMVGSVLSGILLILGSCFVCGGIGRDTINFNQSVTAIMSTLMVVASASFIIPSILYAMSTLDGSPDSIDQGKFLSIVTSIILLMFYVLYLFFQLKSHAHLFQEDQNNNANKLGVSSSSIFLLLATVGVSFCSDALVDSIDGVVEATHVSRAFIGLIVVPIVGNAGEYATTVTAAVRGRMDLAIGIIVGSTLQIALFVTPLMVILGWVFDQPMTLRFDSFETTVFSLSVLVVNYLIQDGRTNYFAGALLVGMYSIIGIAFYVHPDITKPMLLE